MDKSLRAHVSALQKLLHQSEGAQAVVAIGEHLTAVKDGALVEHGEWLDWLHSNFALSADTAQRYMSAFEWANTAGLRYLPDWDKLKIYKTALYYMVKNIDPVPGSNTILAIVEHSRHIWVSEAVARDFLGPMAQAPPKEQAVVAAMLSEKAACEAAERGKPILVVDNTAAVEVEKPVETTEHLPTNAVKLSRADRLTIAVADINKLISEVCDEHVFEDMQVITSDELWSAAEFLTKIADVIKHRSVARSSVLN